MDVQNLTDYKILKKIGEGSLGAAYLAEHRFLKTQVLIKALPDELSKDRGFIQRFEDEVALLATLNHPHIAKIHNVSFDQGHYFLVTDCVVDERGETTTLAQYLVENRDKQSEEATFKLLLQVAQALDYAHHTAIPGTPIVHRSIKFNNVLVAKQGKEVLVQLTDFGLSRIIGAGAVLCRTYQFVAESLGIAIKKGLDYSSLIVDEHKLSALQSSFLQNYSFLAPEQKRPSSDQPITYKVDTYAFGILVYYLLTRRFPEGIFPLPSQLSLPYKLKWDLVIRHCLQSDPNKRPDALVPLMKEIVLPNLPSKNDVLPTPSPEKRLVAIEITQSEEQMRPLIRQQQLELPKDEVDPREMIQVDSAVKEYRPAVVAQRLIEPLSTEMVVIEGGYFMRGSNEGNRDEMPRHQIKLSSFALDIHPVTNEQFVRFLEVMGGEKDRNHMDIIRLKDARIKRSGGKLSIESGYAKHPVVGVTWYGALSYALWVGKRLPTEAEWEVAARGGDDMAMFPTGKNIEKSQANFFSSDTTAVKSYKPNGFGLYDMAGNVYEWCHDWYGYNYYETSQQEPEGPTGPLQGVYRVLRGGCWKSLKEDMICSRRHRNNPGTVNSTYGFRCAADVR